MQSILPKLVSPLRYLVNDFQCTWKKYSEKTPLTAVLCYHRIVKHARENKPYFNVEKGVTAQAFEAQMRFMRKHFSPVAAADVRSPIGAANARLRFAVTFDDGYADNYHIAAPILKKLGIPATFYVVTDHVDGHKAFWWEQLAQMIRATELSSVRLTSLGGNISLRNMAEKEVAHRQLSEALLTKPWVETPQLLANLANVLGVKVNAHKRDLALMTWTQIRDLASQGFDIGGHTASHINIEQAVDAVIAGEITRSMATLQDKLQRCVTSFAYPYGKGSHNVVAIKALNNAGCSLAFSTGKRICLAQDDPMALPRFMLNKPWAFACAYNVDNAVNAAFNANRVHSG